MIYPDSETFDLLVLNCFFSLFFIFYHDADAMKLEIEKIIRSDEAVQKIVEAARTDAKNIRARAREKAKEIFAQKENELAKLKTEAFGKIISEARSKAQNILEETEHYIERLRNRKKEHFEELMNDLLNRVIGS